MTTQDAQNTEIAPSLADGPSALKEPPLEELRWLRRVSAAERPSAAERARGLARLRATAAALSLNSRAPTSRTPRSRPTPRWPVWAVAVASLVLVPAAFAATPLGAHLGEVVTRALPWLPPLAERAARLVKRSPSPGTAQRSAVSKSAVSKSAVSKSAVSKSAAPNSAVAERVESDLDEAATQAVDDVAWTTGEPLDEAAVPGSPPAPVVRHVARPLAKPLASSGRQSPSPSTLPEERKLLQAARLSLAEGDWRSALGRVARYRARFGHGILTAESEIIERQAHELRRARGEL